jgi:hypothetical protein
VEAGHYEGYNLARLFQMVQPWMPMLGIMNIAADAGKKSRRIQLINKKATEMEMTGFVWNAITNIFKDKKTQTVAVSAKCRDY